MQTLGDVITWAMAIVGIILIPYLIIRAWVFPHTRAIWSAIARGFSFMHRSIMSNDQTAATENIPGARHSQQLSEGNNHPIAMGNNAVNEELTVNPGDAGAVNSSGNFIPSEARELIRFQAKAEAIAELINAGLLTNQAKAIEAVYHCSRTSSKRPETPYQKAKLLIEQLINPRPLYYDDLRAKIEAEVQAEGVHS